MTRIPEPVRPALEEYLLFMEKELPGLLAGFYLHGSLALEAFNVHSSDIDFITVVSRRCTASDVDQLRKIHAEVARKYPRWPWQGSYLQWQDLGQFAAVIRLIREAIHIREHTSAPDYRSRIVRAVEAWAFLKYVIRLGNSLVGASQSG